MSERIQQLVTRLHEKSKKDELAWKKAPSGAFQVSFPRSTIAIARMPSVGGESTTYLTIYDQEGAIIEEIYPSDLKRDSSSSVESKRIEELYQIARRKALEADKVIDDILEWLEITS